MIKNNRTRHGKGWVQDMWRVSWQEQRGWTLFFWALCAFASVIMWFQSHYLWTDVGDWQRLGLRLIAPVTIFVLPSLFFMWYSWWTSPR